MITKLVSVDNKGSVGHGFIGVTGDFTYNGYVFVFSSLRSSTVKSITREDNTLTVVTRNTTYVFEEQ